MSTFKADVYEICNEVANEFPGWNFVSGWFKNKSLKHSDLIIHPGFFFDRGFTHLQPAVWIQNKRCSALYAKIFGVQKRQAVATSLVNFQIVAHLLTHMPEHLRTQCLVCADKRPYVAALHVPGQYDEHKIKVLDQLAVDISEVRSVLVAMMKDGISFIEGHYDLGSEENFLRGLPAKYTTRHFNSPYDELDKHKGVMMCIVRTLLADFDFVERYRSDDFQTTFPKRTDDVDKIVAALPDLRKLFADTGSVL